jgi:flavodoxin
MTPRTLIVCKSVHHLNTARIAAAIANVLDADIRSPECLAFEKISDYGLIGFGSGIYFGQLHPALRCWIDEFPTELAQHRNAFIFSTSGLPFLSWLWHRSVRSRLRRKGFNLLAEFHCRGFDTVGPLRFLGGLNRSHPNERDLENAAHFAHAILTRLPSLDLFQR